MGRYRVVQQTIHTAVGLYVYSPRETNLLFERAQLALSTYIAWGSLALSEYPFIHAILPLRVREKAGAPVLVMEHAYMGLVLHMYKKHARCTLLVTILTRVCSSSVDDRRHNGERVSIRPRRLPQHPSPRVAPAARLA